MQTILITGGAGFIGGCLVRQVLAAGETRVVNLDKLTYAGNLDSLAGVRDNARYVFVQGDIGDQPLVGRLLDEYRPAAIVNLAAETHVDRSIDSPAAFIETNVLGTARLLAAALVYWQALDAAGQGAFRFLHVSTDEVFGSLGDSGRFTEASPPLPNSPYAASKAAGDHFVRAYHRTYGLPTLVTNCSNNYGPYQFPEKLVPLVTLAAAEGRAIPIYGDGQQVRDWLHVEDHCQGLLAALRHGEPGEMYCLGADAERTNLQIVEAICRIVDELRPEMAPTAERIQFVEDRPGHDRRYAIDPSKARAALGWRPTHDLDFGLRETVRWYLEHPEWVERVTSGGYRGERLGLGRQSMKQT